MDKIINILKEFDTKKTLYDSLCLKSEQLIKEILNVQGIIVHHLSHRTKERNKIREKVIRKGYKYSNLNQITDVAGIRVITFFAEYVDKVADIISTEFNIDLKNTIDKRILAEDQFGYMSLHYVASISNNRLKLAEYKPYKGLKFEIQIRSILQHGWAEIEHDLGYKGAKGIPSGFKRDFNRIAALLETADNEFHRLRRELSIYDEEVEKDYTLKPSKLDINNSTLKKFFEQNKTLYQVNTEIAKYYAVELDNNPENVEHLGELSEKIKTHGIKTINQLNRILEQNKKQLIFNIPSLKTDRDIANVSGVDSSVGLHTLLDFIDETS